MSMSLYYYPPPQLLNGSLSKGLKFLISQRAWGHDGSLGGDPVEIGSEWVGFLSGIAIAAVDADTRESAQVLIDAIDRHGYVFIALRG